MSGFANTVLGGASKLIRAAIQSPNFVTGVSGWSIRKDGSAEFNNLVIRNGQIISGIQLIYSSTPAANNLVYSNTSNGGGTDSFGNVYLNGATVYSKVLIPTLRYIAINIDQAQIGYFLSIGSEAGPWNATAHMQDITAASVLGVFPGLNLVNDAATVRLILATNNIIMSNHPMVMLDPNDNTKIETWHALSSLPLLNGWALTSSNFAHYRMTIEGEIEFAGALSGGAATNVNIASIPSGPYRPATQSGFAVGCTAGVIAGQSAFVNLSPGGTLFAQGITPGTVAQAITLNGRIPLTGP